MKNLKYILFSVFIGLIYIGDLVLSSPVESETKKRKVGETSNDEEVNFGNSIYLDPKFKSMKDTLIKDDEDNIGKKILGMKSDFFEKKLDLENLEKLNLFFKNIKKKCIEDKDDKYSSVYINDEEKEKKKEIEEEEEAEEQEEEVQEDVQEEEEEEEEPDWKNHRLTQKKYFNYIIEISNKYRYIDTGKTGMEPYKKLLVAAILKQHNDNVSNNRNKIAVKGGINKQLIDAYNKDTNIKIYIFNVQSTICKATLFEDLLKKARLGIASGETNTDFNQKWRQVSEQEKNEVVSTALKYFIEDKRNKVEKITYTKLVEKFQSEIGQTLKIISEYNKAFVSTIEEELNRIVFNEENSPLAMYASYYLLYLEIQNRKILNDKLSYIFVASFKGKKEKISLDYIREFKSKNKLDDEETRERIKNVLENPKAANIFDRHTLKRFRKQMNERFSLLYGLIKN